MRRFSHIRGHVKKSLTLRVSAGHKILLVLILLIVVTFLLKFNSKLVCIYPEPHEQNQLTANLAKEDVDRKNCIIPLRIIHLPIVLLLYEQNA